MPSFNVALQDVALLLLQDLCPVFVGLKADVITRKEKQRKESSRNPVVYPRLEHMGVSKNNGTPKSSILIGFSIIFTIHFGGFPPIFGSTPI